MKIQLLETNQTITGIAGTYVVTPGFQILHYNKPCLVRINVLSDEPLNSYVVSATAVVDNLPGATLTLPIFDDSIIDLSVIASYLATFQKDLETGTGRSASLRAKRAYSSSFATIRERRTPSVILYTRSSSAGKSGALVKLITV